MSMQLVENKHKKDSLVKVKVVDNAVDQITHAEIKELALQHKILVVKNIEFSEAPFKRFIDTFGHKVEHTADRENVGYGYKDILHLDGNSDGKKVITGRGPLGLHTDGILLRVQVDFIFLYSELVDEVDNEGATTVCDSMAAWDNMPEPLKKIILNEKFEYQAIEKGYFSTFPDGWNEIPIFRDYGRAKSLNIAMPADKNYPASWDVRINGFDSDQNERFFKDLNDHFENPKYYYKHYWKNKELLIIDNQKTLHGREKISQNTVRKLLRGQITL